MGTERETRVGRLEGLGHMRGAGQSMGFIPRVLRSLVGLGTEEVCDWVYDSKKPLWGFQGKWGLLRMGVDVGAASYGDGRAWTRVDPEVQRSACILHVFGRWSQGDPWQGWL